MTRLTYTEVVKAGNDAGVLRQFIVETYGCVLTHGGAGPTMKRAYLHLNELARKIRQPLDEVLADIRTDFEVWQNSLPN